MSTGDDENKNNHDNQWEVEEDDDNDDDNDYEDEDDDDDDEDDEDQSSSAEDELESGSDDDDDDDDDNDDSEREEEGEGEEDFADEGVYQSDEDDDNDDDIELPPQDDIDPEYEGLTVNQPAEYYQADYDADAEDKAFKDEHPEDREGRFTNRLLMIASAICCCLIMVLGIFLIVYFLVLKDSNGGDGSTSSGNRPSVGPPSQPAQIPTPQVPTTSVPFSYPTAKPVTPSPTVEPTPIPTISPLPTEAIVVEPTVPTPKPTEFPTITPTESAAPTQLVADEMVLIPVADTYIRDGFEKSEAHGDRETLLVQNAVDSIVEIPDSFALLQFDMTTVPFARIQNRQLTATLELVHEVSVVDREEAIYTIERLPRTVLDIDTLFYTIFPVPEDSVRGSNFTVAPSDELIEIDVTDLIFGGLYEPEDDDQALFMIVQYGQEDDVGDEFRSREYVGSEPKLRLSLIQIPGVPDSTPPPVPPPSPEPTEQGSESQSPTNVQ